EFSQDGRSLLVISEERELGPRNDLTQGRVEIWDARTGKSLFKPIRLPKPVRQHCLSPDGKKLFTLDEDNTCRLWNARTGQPLGPEWRTVMASQATFSNDGAKVFLADWEMMQGQLWDPIRGKPSGPPLPGTNDWRLSPDARMVFASSHLVEAETGLPLTPKLGDYPHNDFLFSA